MAIQVYDSDENCCDAVFLANMNLFQIFTQKNQSVG